MSNHRRALVVSIVVVGLLAAREARADDPPTRWYGWQTLTVYGADLVLGYAMLHVHRPRLLSRMMSGTYVGTLAVGGAAVHAAHRRWTAAAGAVGLEVVAPAIAGAAGWTACSGPRSRLICAGLFGALAWGIGATIDVAALAHEPTAPPAPSARQRSQNGARAVAPLRVGFRF